MDVRQETVVQRLAGATPGNPIARSWTIEAISNIEKGVGGWPGETQSMGPAAANFALAPANFARDYRGPGITASHPADARL